MLLDDDRTIEVMNDVKTSIILCGHSHVQRKIVHNKKCVLNPGAVGMPLVADFTSNSKSENIKFHWITEQGTFLNREQGSGRANVLGKDVKSSEQKIYWSIDPNEEINKSPFTIYLKIENKDASKVIYETSIEVEKSKGGFFYIRK